VILQIWEAATTAKRMKIDSYCHCIKDRIL